MGWIDNIVVGIIVVGGLFIFYRALKEPVDMVFGAIGKGLGSIKDSIVNRTRTPAETYEELVYG